MTELESNLNTILNDKLTNLTPENLKKGVTCLGVTGTLDASTTSGGVKRFNTIEEMNSSTGNTEGDLAIVYGDRFYNLVTEAEVSYIVFPETVILPATVTTNHFANLQKVNDDDPYIGTCSIKKNDFSFDISVFESNMVIQLIGVSYTSTDGITYTRTVFHVDTSHGEITNSAELPVPMKMPNINEWNDVFGYFMQNIVSTFEGIYIYKDNNWKLAPTQLNTTPDYVYEKLFYGSNGIGTGTLTQNVSNSFADTNANVYSKIKSVYDNMQPKVLTDNDKVIDKNIYFIPVNVQGELLLDTSNVTNASGMFNNCTNLTTIPSLDTSNMTDTSNMFNNCTNLTNISALNVSNVTNASDMFAGCKNLVTIPLLDTSKVTDISGMFSDCTNLTAIPLLDTSKAKNMSGMFNYCSNLTTIPLLDTSDVTNMFILFSNCSNLTTIPVLNTSNVTDMFDTFSNCKKLSDDSLNNILAMCTNAVKITSNKTLDYVGLTEEQANRCKTLSNYSAFTAAGWTTGY